MPRTDRLKSFASIGQTLDRSRHPVLEEAVNRYQALSPLGTVWKRSVDQPLCRHTQPVSLENGTLIVHAASPVWANLLRNTEHSVIATLQKSGLPEVQRLRIRLAPPPAPQSEAPAAQSVEHSSKYRRLFSQLRKALG